MLVVDRLSKSYGLQKNAYLALEAISLSIPKGSFVSLLGASGCGKSTLLNILAGFESPTQGQVTLNGRAVTRPDHNRVMCFQDANEALFPWLTARGNVELAMRLAKAPIKHRREVGEQLLKLVGLWEHVDKYPRELSGGMRQRLQIARALTVNPEVLLMDEPFGALDAITRRHMQTKLAEIWQATGKSIVFVTHDIAEAIYLSDKIVVMSKGPGSRILREFTVDLPRPRDPSNPAFGVLSNEIEALFSIGGHEETLQ
jgi:NitT/TauT family transport system ATP-binding protein